MRRIPNFSGVIFCDECSAMANRRGMITHSANCKFHRKHVASQHDNDQKPTELEAYSCALSTAEIDLANEVVKSLGYTLTHEDFHKILEFQREQRRRSYYSRMRAWIFGEPTCLINWCRRPMELRGLCAGHYVHIGRLVRAGDTTWAELERRHKVLPSKRAISDENLLENTVGGC